MPTKLKDYYDYLEEQIDITTALAPVTNQKATNLYLWRGVNNMQDHKASASDILTQVILFTADCLRKELTWPE